MKLAIIGAGEGSRLRDEGITVPKPLIPINGVPLIDRIIRTGVSNGASSVHLIINAAFGVVKEHLESVHFGVPIDCELLSTPSSMHTLFALAPKLQGESFCMATVDTVFRERDFRKFVQYALSNGRFDGVLAITDYIDDEKPLCVTLDPEKRIIEFMDSSERSHWATGGIYFFSPSIFRQIELALERKIERLRNFLRLLVEQGYDLRAFQFSKIIDVDHVADIQAAEQFLSGND
ncbi:MAG TPA: sugar phosphate nucleotidyltransferase [Candidatus Acidoferrum sp.]|nr:sugar phosphate nucleotidyltransferase [Candidatus Acidoferrum sp.]